MIPQRSAREGAKFSTCIEHFLLRGWGRRLSGPGWQAAFLLLALMLASYCSYEAVADQITETGVLHEDRVSLASYLAGTVNRPFAFRIVTPALVNFAQKIVGVPALLRAMPGPLAGKLSLWCGLVSAVPAPTCDNVAAYFAVAAGYCFSFFMIVYATCLRLFRGNPVIASLGILFAFFIVNAVLLMHLSHIYDFGVLMFAALLLLCLERQWNVAFTLLLPLGFLTKETLIIYGAAFFMVNLGRIRFDRLLLFAAIQLVAFFVLHAFVQVHFAGNPGDGHEYYLPDWITFFSQEVTLTRLLPMLLVLVILFYGFRQKPVVLRRGSIVLLPWLAIALLFGDKKEVRITMEILPLVVLLGLDTFVQMFLGGSGRSTAAD